MAISLPIISKFDSSGIKQAEGALGGFKSALGKVGIAAAAAFAVSGVAIAKFVKSSVGEASNLEESLNAVSVAYGGASSAIVKLGEDASTRLGVTQTDFNAAAVRFSAFAERVVGTGGDVAGFVDDITTRASDFASVFNIEVSEALQVFQSGLAGEAEPLKRFGINLLQSEVQAFALREGLISVGQEMTEQEKVQARYGLLMEETAKTAGDFANTSDGLANSQRILKASFADMQAEVGGPVLNAFANLSAGLLPVVEQLGPVLTDALAELAPKLDGVVDSVLKVLPSLVTFAGGLSSTFETLDARFASLRGSVQPAIDAFLEMRDRLPEVGDAFGKVLSAVQTISAMGFPALLAIGLQVATQLLPALIDAFIEILPPVLDLIEAASGVLVPVLTTLAQVVIPIFVGILNILTPIIKGVATVLAGTGSSLTILALIIYGGIKAFALFRTAVLIAQGVQLGFAAATYGAVGATLAQTTAAKVGLVTANLLNGTYLMQAGALLTNTVHMIANRVALISSAVATNVAAVAVRLFNAALAANPIGLIVGLLAALTAGLIYFLTNTETGKAIVVNVMDFFKRSFEAVGNTFSFIFGTIMPAVGESFMAAVKELGENIAGFGAGFMEVLSIVGVFFKDIINGYIGIWESFINFFINGINLIIRGLNRLKVNLPATPFSGPLTIGVNIPEIPNVSLPRLAEGGIVKARPGGIIANIGEGGQDEAVIPLNKMGKMGGNTYVVNITANVADARLGEVVVNAIKRYERTSGPVFASA